MIPEIIMFATLSCPQTIMINQTKDSWNTHDKDILKIAQKRCGELYEDAPCVKKFYKRPEDSYWCICGK